MKKAILANCSILLVFLALPIYVEHFCTPAEKEGWCFTMFLMINPISVALLGIFAGSDLKKLWFMPILGSLVFAPFFWLSILEFDSSILIYVPIYFIIAVITMGVSEMLFDRAKQKRTE